MGEMRVLGKEGDVTHEWDPNKPDEVAVAKKTFNDLKKKGYTAHLVNTKGGKGRIIDEFDPQDGKIIMVPSVVGG